MEDPRLRYGGLSHSLPASEQDACPLRDRSGAARGGRPAPPSQVFAGGAAALGAGWLAFFPPASYQRWVAARALAVP
jgi:hypothetical protein